MTRREAEARTGHCCWHSPSVIFYKAAHSNWIIYITFQMKRSSHVRSDAVFLRAFQRGLLGPLTTIHVSLWPGKCFFKWILWNENDHKTTNYVAWSKRKSHYTQLNLFTWHILYKHTALVICSHVFFWGISLRDSCRPVKHTVYSFQRDYFFCRE